MQLDNDLSLPPFVPITDADLEPLARAAIERELPNLPYSHRVTIAWLAAEHTDRGAWFIHTHLLIEHNIDIDPRVIDAFLATIR